MTKLFVVGVLLAATCGPEVPGPGEEDPRDVTGNYDLTYDDSLHMQLNIGGAVREVTQQGYGGVADFGTYNGQPVRLDLTQFCAKPEVKCPSEQFWAKVAIDQPNLKKNGFGLQELRVIDNQDPTPPAGTKAASVTGLVNHDDGDRFLVGLGLQAGASGSCAAIDVSFASGRFAHQGETLTTTMEYRGDDNKVCNPDAGAAALDAGSTGDGGTAAKPCTLKSVSRLTYPDGAPIADIKDGRIGFAWAGGCAFGPFLAGATLYLETGYSGKRTGDYDPPPFTPAPVTQPDGGFPDAG
ncbi:MAG: hypothetical protein JNK82_30030 [Myxococcaceae bacterium]|nr:hypothetical protein [Myxococcaceae bacterium]